MDEKPVKLFPDHVMRDTAEWASYFAADWRMELPDRLHTTVVAADGTPAWTQDFERWLTGQRIYTRRNDDQRRRTTQVMRKLRNVSPREYEVLYRMLVLGDSVEQTTTWLNERAQRNEIPLPRGREVHYRTKDTLALMIAGITFAKAHW
jgi:hypothetical protein